MCSTEAVGCAVADPLWHVLSWIFLALWLWLLFLFYADTLERGVIFQDAKRPMTTSFRIRSFMWLAALVLGAFAAWNVWTDGCWSVRGIELSLYSLTLLPTVFSWRLFWASHRAMAAAVSGTIAFLMSLVTLLVFFSVSPVSGVLYVLYPFVQLYDAAYSWMFYRMNVTANITNRPTGRFSEKNLHRIADIWFVNPQQPSLHIIESNFLQDPTSLADV